MTEAEFAEQLYPIRQSLLEQALESRQVELEIGVLDGDELTL